MAYEFKFPDVGEGITEGELHKWLIAEGDDVKENQPIAKVETDKAVVEIPSPKTGKILKLHFKEGETIQVGRVLATIGERGEVITATPTPAKAEKKATPAAKTAAMSSVEAAAKAGSVVGFLEEAPVEEAPKRIVTKTAAAVEVSGKEFLATPAARAAAKEAGIDLSTITPTGPGGSVTIDDVQKAAGTRPNTQATRAAQHILQPAPAASAIKIVKKYDMYGYLERVPIKGVRKATAKKMVESVTHAVHVTHMDEADVTRLVEIREHEKEELKKKGIKLTYLPFVVKALIAALKEHPYLNATMDEENREIILKKYYNIGIAVDTPDGLIVPVIKIADKKSIVDLAQEIEKIAKQSADRTINMADLKGGTFTITNVGVIGGIFATPIINYPEVAILLTGKIYEKAMLKNGSMQFRKVMPLSVTFDHRVLDGVEAARFTNKLISYLEDPDLFLFEK
ncbi:2-oxo acid dehydrogenase subunit E2 [Candidatus Woesearchaeota archaeon]|nr:2-oxo acid dehydrogenase subunit E2 [Candidatus Woesearchaeota archaeon]